MAGQAGPGVEARTQAGRTGLPPAQGFAKMARMEFPTIPSQRHLFDIPAEVAYLNCAYMGPLMHSVIEAGEQGLRAKARPWGIDSGDFFAAVERARSLFADVIGADAEGVALVPSASYGLSCAARNMTVPSGGHIIVLAEQFPSNVYAWREVANSRGATLTTVPRPSDGDWTRAVLEVIDGRASIVALPHCHWTDGGWLDLVRIGARCRDAGAQLVLDLTQSAGALRFDAGAVQPDYVACAGYKWLLGPLFPRLSLGGSRAPRRTAHRIQIGPPVRERRTSRASSTTAADTGRAHGASMSGRARISSWYRC